MDARVSKGLKPMDSDTFQSVVRLECTQAVDWIESNITTPREVSESYYLGKTAQKHEPGRSGIVVSVVRDAIHAILPNIARIFTQTDTVAEFSSDDEEDEQICQDMTKFVNGVFNKYDGYKALIYGVTDSLKSRIGVAKVTLQRIEVASHQISSMMSHEELEELQIEAQIGDVMITEVSEPMMPEGMYGTEDKEVEYGKEDTEDTEDTPLPQEMMQYQVAMTRKSFRNKWMLEPVPPESLIVDAEATCVENARIIGTRRNMPIYEAMAMGLAFEDLEGQTEDDSSTMQSERFNRRGYDPNDYADNWSQDVTNKRVLITEAWLRIDADGDGVAELRHLICAGVNYEVLVDEVTHCVPLSIFMVDLQPHVFFPISLAEDLIQDQDSQTVITRSILDNVALVNSPRTEVNDSQVNLEDVKNNEIGAIVRVKQIGQINELTTPFVAGQTMPVLEYLHQLSETRSGVTKLSQGIDPNALQATSRIAANAAVQGSDSRIEMMARNIAETGVKSLFQAILRVAMYELKGEQSIKTPTGYRMVNPGLWHDQININLNVGLGNGRIEEKQQTLQSIIGFQQQLMQQYGLINPLCGWENVRNTLKANLRLSGIRNVGWL
jgi:transcription termination factor NusB